MSSLSLTPETRIVVVGLGYVGLPLAVALAKKYDVLGFDISEQRIAELKDGFDRTEEIEKERLVNSSLEVTSAVEEIKDGAVYIVTVPTPVDDNNKPDLTPVRASCETLGPVIGKNSIIVFESTVYPWCYRRALWSDIGRKVWIGMWKGFLPWIFSRKN